MMIDPNQERPRVPIAEVPTIVSLGVTPNQRVLMEISQPTGVTVVVFDPDAARQTGENLIAQARQAGSGLIVPKPIVDLRENGEDPK